MISYTFQLAVHSKTSKSYPDILTLVPVVLIRTNILEYHLRHSQASRLYALERTCDVSFKVGLPLHLVVEEL